MLATVGTYVVTNLPAIVAGGGAVGEGVLWLALAGGGNNGGNRGGPNPNLKGSNYYNKNQFPGIGTGPLGPEGESPPMGQPRFKGGSVGYALAVLAVMYGVFEALTHADQGANVPAQPSPLPSPSLCRHNGPASPPPLPPFASASPSPCPT